MRSRRRLILFVAGALAATPFVAASVWLRSFPARHFAAVREDVLYRGGQPSEAGWRAIRDWYHVRTVVNLRPMVGQPWAVTEREFCRRNGIELIEMPMTTRRITEEEVLRFLRIATDPARQPVLVHCEHGRSRTGVLVGAYRVAVEGWSYANALADARRFGFRPEISREYDRLLQELAGGAGRRPHGASADNRGRGEAGPECRADVEGGGLVRGGRVD